MSGVTLPKDRRVQFDVLPERVAELDQLMVFCGMSTRKELFDNATTLFEWAVDEVRKGNQIASFNRSTDDVEVVRFPVLDRAARKAQSSQEVPLAGPTRAGASNDLSSRGLPPARLVLASET